MGVKSDGPADLLQGTLDLLILKTLTRGEMHGYDLIAHVRQISGVAPASLATAVPMRGVDYTWVIGPRNGRRAFGNMRAVDPDYFGLMQMRLKSGRFLTSSVTLVVRR